MYGHQKVVGEGIMQPEPKGERHSWHQIEFKKEGAPLWECIHCKEVSYDALPDYRGCFPKGTP